MGLKISELNTIAEQEGIPVDKMRMLLLRLHFNGVVKITNDQMFSSDQPISADLQTLVHREVAEAVQYFAAHLLYSPHDLQAGAKAAADRILAALPELPKDEPVPTDLEICRRWISEIEHWVDESVPQPALALMLGARRDLMAAAEALQEGAE